MDRKIDIIYTKFANTFILQMAVPSDWLDGTHLSILESSTLEFKKSVMSASLTKITETLCAFLNTMGGTIVIGIDDTSREIVGVPLCKSVDTFLLSLDTIYHNADIRTIDGKNIPVGTLTVHTIVTKRGQRVITITATPSQDTRYQMSDGTIWSRLAASNYRMRTPLTLFTNQEVEKRIKTRVDAVHRQMQSQLDRAQHDAQNMKQDFTSLVSVAQKNEHQFGSVKKQLESDISTIYSLLTESILSHKKCIEKLHEDKKQSIWEWLFCM
jgi:predicted HTH transcriptional regulator